MFSYKLAPLAALLSSFILMGCETSNISAQNSYNNAASRTSYADQTSPVLWYELNAATDIRKIMLIEAELASRGQTSLGDQYLGQKTAVTVGKSIYARTGLISDNKNCSDFSSPATAQRFFLTTGGPMEDPHGLDRDGDGNACEWGKTLQVSVASYKKRNLSIRPSPVRVQTSSRCYTGSRGGTYTITASGNKNYDGC